MSYTDTLNTLAEIAITLIGFSGIVIIFGNRFTRGLTPKEEVQFFALLATPLTALFCSFIPTLLSTILDDSEFIWRLSNAILGVLHLANISYFVFKLTHATISQIILMVGGFIMISVHLLASVNIIPFQEFVFILGLLQQLSIGVHNFILLFRHSEETAT